MERVNDCRAALNLRRAPSSHPRPSARTAGGHGQVRARTPLSRHIEGSNGWAFGASEAGKCENQKIYLYRVGAQHHFGLRLRDDEPTITYKNDLLGVILEAKQRGCTDKQIQKVLTKTRK